MSEQNYIKGQRLSKTQYSLLSRSLIVAGVGFGFIALFSWLFYFIYSTTNVSANAVNAMYFISIILIIVVAFMSVSLMAKTMLAPHNVKKTTPFIMFGLYSIAEGIGFGTLFYAIHESAGNSPIHIEDLWGVFGVGCAIFMLAGIIGSFLSLKATMTIGKFLFFISIAILIVLPIIWIVGMFGVHIDNVMLTIYSVMAFVFFLYIMYDFSVIRKMSPFIAMTDGKVQFLMAMMFGFKLLIDFIGLIWIMIRILIMIRR